MLIAGTFRKLENTHLIVFPSGLVALLIQKRPLTSLIVRAIKLPTVQGAARVSLVIICTADIIVGSRCRRIIMECELQRYLNAAGCTKLRACTSVDQCADVLGRVAISERGIHLDRNIRKI